MLFQAVLLLLADRILPFNFPAQAGDFSQLVVAANSQPLRAFADNNGVWRHQIDTQQASKLYLEALINYEDRWFYYHFGVNPLALLRATWQNINCNCVVSGGSTLSMQVARRFHPHRKTMLGKLGQMLRALQLEWHLSKDEILNLYLNYAPFGGTIEGVQAASYAYLQKPLAQVTHAEAALLAVLPQAPSRMRPDRYPQRATVARDKVLTRMLRHKVWSKQQVNMAKQEQLIAHAPHWPQLAPLLARHLINKYPEKQLIHTTIDMGMQQYLQQDIASWINSQGKHSSAAILVIDNRQQAVVAYVGSADFGNSMRFGHVDMVQAIRSPGSALKPFVYAMAIEEGLIHSHSLLSDAPLDYDGYRPQNFNRGFMGPVSATYALQQSLNVPAVQVLRHFGAGKFYNRLQNSGIKLYLPANAQPNLSLVLGGGGISLWDLSVAFSAFAQRGQLIKPRLLVAANKPAPRYLMHEDAAWIVYDILRRQAAPNTAFSSLALRQNYIAYKTGTSYGYRDAWAVGVSKNYTIGVWLGRPDGTPQPGHYGALNAAPKLLQIANMLHGEQKGLIAKPKTVVEATICWPLGYKSSNTKPQFCHRQFEANLFANISPRTWHESKKENWHPNPLHILISQDKHLLSDIRCQNLQHKTTQIALWPGVLEPWLPQRWRRSKQIPAADSRCKYASNPGIVDLSIKHLNNDSEFKLARGKALPQIALAATGGLGVRSWFVNGYYIGNSYGENALLYKFKHRGSQQILVRDQLGNADMVTVNIAPAGA